MSAALCIPELTDTKRPIVKPIIIELIITEKDS